MNTLKERFAAKKAAKKQKNIAQSFKQNHAYAKKYNYLVHHTNRKLLLDLPEKLSPEEMVQFRQADLDLFEDLVYYRPNVAQRLKCILIFGQVLAELFRGIFPVSAKIFAELVQYAQAEVFDFYSTPNQSPNERRAAFAELDLLITAIGFWVEHISRQCIEYIENYASAVLASKILLDFYALAENDLLAMAEVAKGASLHDCTKHFKTTRQNILTTAMHAVKFCQIADIYQNTPLPENIAQLRQIKDIIDFDTIAQLSVCVIETIQDFTNKTGIDVVNLPKFAASIAALQRQLGKEKPCLT